MEIYYTNQYGTWDKNVFDIIEIHRYVKEDFYFGGNDMRDFPDSGKDAFSTRI